MSWEVLCDERLTRRAARFLSAMAHARDATLTSEYKGDAEVLMLYGAGSPARRRLLERHRAAGGRVVCWDIGYWDRSEAMRLAVDGFHPTPAQLALAAARAPRRTFVMRNDADPAGPILLVGYGPKSSPAYDLPPASDWAHAKIKELKLRFPAAQIAWRPKGPNGYPAAGTTLRHGMPIEEALRGCALVVCAHSNVAVDACEAGVPVECSDGAARALYGATSTPTAEARQRFLDCLSWFEWRPEEADSAVEWIGEVLS